MEGLQILHIAGDEASVLGSFPLETEVFERMDNLQELRLENLRKLRSLPPFPEEASAGLRLMVLRDLPFVHSIPVIGHLGNLRVLVITDLPRLERLPLLPGKLRILHVEMPTALCCNGYLDDGTKVCGSKTDSILASQCRLLDIASNSSELCLSSDTLNSTQTIHTQQWLAAVGFQCSNSNAGDTDYASTLNSITRASVEACDGAMYRECSLPILDINTSSGMCLGASRLQVVHCVPKDPRYQAMRRAEILQRPGGCNRAFERWLGC